MRQISRRFETRTARICGAALLALALFATAHAAEPNSAKTNTAQPKIRPARDTTYILTPLDSEGYVDYLAAINEPAGRGVLSNDNVVVGYHEVAGSISGESDEYYRLLGMTKPKFNDPRFKETSEWSMTFSEDESTALTKQRYETEQRAWKSRDFPLMTRWLRDNDAHLDRFVEATKRSRYYRPLVPRESNRTYEIFGHRKLTTPWLGAADDRYDLTYQQSIGDALACRACNRVAEGRFSQARSDLLAAHRWARHVASGPMADDITVGFRVEASASWADKVFLEYIGTDAAEIRPLLDGLNKLPPLPIATAVIERSSRFIYLDAVQRICRSDYDVLNWIERKRSKDSPQTPTAADLARFAKFDYAIVMREGNQWFDRATAMIKHPDRTSDKRPADAFEEEVEQLKKKFYDREVAAKSVFELIQSEKELAEYLISQLLPKASFERYWTDWASQTSEFSHVATALALYRAERGRYPERLAELKPLYLSSIPRDRYDGRELKYHREKNLYVLYGVGRNGLDERGENGLFEEMKSKDPDAKFADDELFRFKPVAK